MKPEEAPKTWKTSTEVFSKCNPIDDADANDDDTILPFDVMIQSAHSSFCSYVSHHLQLSANKKRNSFSALVSVW